VHSVSLPVATHCHFVQAVSICLKQTNRNYGQAKQSTGKRYPIFVQAVSRCSCIRYPVLRASGIHSLYLYVLIIPSSLTDS